MCELHLSQSKLLSSPSDICIYGGSLGGGSYDYQSMMKATGLKKPVVYAWNAFCDSFSHPVKTKSR